MGVSVQCAFTRVGDFKVDGCKAVAKRKTCTEEETNKQNFRSQTNMNAVWIWSQGHQLVIGKVSKVRACLGLPGMAPFP